MAVLPTRPALQNQRVEFFDHPATAVVHPGIHRDHSGHLTAQEVSPI